MKESNINKNLILQKNKNKINNIGQKETQNLTTFESKKYNDFLGVFGVHADNSKYFKPKKIRKQCKTPNKDDKINNILENNNMNEIQLKKRACKSPFKLNNLLFSKKTKDLSQNKSTINENKLNEKKEIFEIIEKPSKIYELSFYQPFNENVKLLDGEGNSYNIEFIRNEFEIMKVFNDNIYNSCNDIHFTNDFFSFPQYCIKKVKYNPDTRVTSIKLKDYRSFKFKSKNDEFFKKVNFIP